MDKVFNLLIVGVGGQGTILASNIVTQAAMNAGLDAKKSEITKQLKNSMPDKVSNSISEKTGSTIKNLLKK